MAEEAASNPTLKGRLLNLEVTLLLILEVGEENEGDLIR
jgi:hypothetical protein